MHGRSVGTYKKYCQKSKIYLHYSKIGSKLFAISKFTSEITVNIKCRGKRKKERVSQHHALGKPFNISCISINKKIIIKEHCAKLGINQLY